MVDAEQEHELGKNPGWHESLYACDPASEGAEQNQIERLCSINLDGTIFGNIAACSTASSALMFAPRRCLPAFLDQPIEEP